MTDHDRRLAERLRRYESRVPDPLTPPEIVGVSRRSWVPLAGVAAVVLLAVALATTLSVVREPTGQASPTAAASEAPSPSPTPAAASASATSSPSETESSTQQPASPSAPPGVAFDVEWEDVATVIDTGTVMSVTEDGGSFHVLGSVAEGAVVWSSNDGETWARALLPFPAGWEPGPPTSVYAEHLVAAGDRTLIVGSAVALDHLNVIVWQSTDGVTWTEVDTGAFKTDAYRALDVASGPAGIVAVTHRYGEGKGSAWRSQDGGRSWTEHRPVGGPMTAYAVVGTGDRYVIAGDELDAEFNRSPRIWTSPDGAAWTPAAVEGSDGTGSIQHVALDGAGTWVAAGTLDGRSVAWRSSDAVTWSLVQDFGPTDPQSGMPISLLTCFPEGYLAIGGGSERVLWTSADGELWDQRPLPMPELEGVEGTLTLTTGIGRVDDRLLLAGQVVTHADPAGSTWQAWLGRLVPGSASE
jgi:hypothetical protein